MIISASRRTDIPAFYAEWFINRVRAGFCTASNPYNRRQLSHVALQPEDVDVVVFWTRNARPLFPYLDELDRRGLRYYVQYTVLDNPRQLEPATPALDAAVRTFRELAARVGPDRVIWRYDPIVFSTLSGFDFHRERFSAIAARLEGATRRAVVSVVDRYKKADKRMAALAAEGILPLSLPLVGAPEFGALMVAMAQEAAACGMEIQSCAEEIDLQQFGIRPGKCIDDELIARVFGVTVSGRKDAGQRQACGCVASRDIGAYDACLFGCQYCYATSSFVRARINYGRHDPQSPSLLPFAERPDESTPEELAQVIAHHDADQQQ